jgi:putative sterol carrier protein
MTDINTLEEELGRRVLGKKPTGKTISFKLNEEGTLRLDARTDPVKIERSEEPSDATITISPDDLQGLLDGSVNGQSLMMTGRAKMAGNPTVMMKLRDLLT